MEKSFRCTVCTWRGNRAEAAAARVQPVALPPQLEAIQAAYEEKEVEEAHLGIERHPTCPMCGHHTLPVKLHRHHAAA